MDMPAPIPRDAPVTMAVLFERERPDGKEVILIGRRSLGYVLTNQVILSSFPFSFEEVRTSTCEAYVVWQERRKFDLVWH